MLVSARFPQLSFYFKIYAQLDFSKVFDTSKKAQFSKVFCKFFQTFKTYFQRNAQQEEEIQEEVFISFKQTIKSQKQRSQQRKERTQVEKRAIPRNSQKKQQQISLKKPFSCNKKQIVFEIPAQYFLTKESKPRQQTCRSSSAITERKEKFSSKCGTKSSPVNAARRRVIGFKIQVHNARNALYSRCGDVASASGPDSHRTAHTFTHEFALNVPGV